MQVLLLLDLKEGSDSEDHAPDLILQRLRSDSVAFPVCCATRRAPPSTTVTSSLPARPLRPCQQRAGLPGVTDDGEGRSGAGAGSGVAGAAARVAAGACETLKRSPVNGKATLMRTLALAAPSLCIPRFR